MDIILSLIGNGMFAAIAAIGFGSISNVPIRSFPGCALLAATGHTLRLVLMKYCAWGIISGSFMAGICIGLLSIPASRHWRCPAESLSFPALLPMIPGMYAYRAVQSFVLCIQNNEEARFSHYFYLFNYNWIVCILAIILMVVGITLPIFLFRNKSFSATR